MTLETLDRMPYTRAVVRETLRLRRASPFRRLEPLALGSCTWDSAGHHGPVPDDQDVPDHRRLHGAQGQHAGALVLEQPARPGRLPRSGRVRARALARGRQRRAQRPEALLGGASFPATRSEIASGAERRRCPQYGSGPHRCIGYEYANMHMAAVLGTASVLLDWEHEVTPDSSDYAMLPTCVPVLCVWRGAR